MNETRINELLLFASGYLPECDNKRDILNVLRENLNVIHCKDCKYCNMTAVYYCGKLEDTVCENDYCSSGRFRYEK